MKTPYLTLFLTASILAFSASEASATQFSNAKVGTCYFYQGDQLSLSQRCAIQPLEQEKAPSKTLFWEDNVRTEIKVNSPSDITVDGEEAEAYSQKGRKCYRILKNEKSICFAIDDRESFLLNYGCGTGGCRVLSLMITNVRRNSHKLNGKILNSASFFSFTKTAVKANWGDTRHVGYVYASCRTNEIGYGDKIKGGPNPNSWHKLFGDDRDYTTVMAGRIHYFNALCK
jgi:hypothetical protein